MKKILLSLLSLVVCAAVCAQEPYEYNTKETAEDLVFGTNSKSFDEDASIYTVWYKYAAPDDQDKVIIIKSQTPSLSVEDADGNRITVGYFDNYQQRMIPVGKGVTAYIKVSSYDASYSFDAELRDCDLEGGKTCDDALQATDGVDLLVPRYTDDDGSTVPTYVAYDATEDGVLQIEESAYISEFTVMEGCDDTGETVSASSSTDRKGYYVGKVEATAGKRYIVPIKIYGSTSFVTITMTHPTEGSSCDMPFTVSSETTNTIPAEAGRYWYTYTATKDGYAVMSSESTLPGGTIEAYSSCTSTYSTIGSVSGCMKLRVPVTAETSIVFKVEKAEATEAPDEFTFTEVDAQAGDSFDNPMELVLGENTVPDYNGTYYYSLTVPEGDAKMLKIDASEAGITNSSTKMTAYKSTSQYSALAYGQTSLSVEAQAGLTYILKWVLAEDNNAFKFTAALNDVEAGETASKPIEAVLGENALAASTVRYYTYTATKGCWLAVDIADDDITVSFPKDPTTSYSGNYTMQTNGTVHRIEATEGTKYYIVFKNTSADTTFTLSEVDYAKGEGKENPIEITEEVTELPEAAISYYYHYTAPKTGKLTVKSDLVYEMDYDTYVSTYVTVTIGDDGYPESIMQYGDEDNYYEGTFPVTEGDDVYIYVRIPYAQTGKTLTLTMRDFVQGETSDNPLPLETGTMNVPLTSYSNPMWYSVSLAQGDSIIIYADDYFSASMFETSDLENAVIYSNYEYDEETWEALYYIAYKRTDEGSADYLVEIDYSYYAMDVTVKIIRATTGIESLNAEGAAEGSNMQVFDLQGRKVFDGDTTKGLRLNRGVYIVNGRKVVVK